MQFQSDIINSKVIRPKITETTALGAAYLAGLAVGFWKDLATLQQHWQTETVFSPSLNDSIRKTLQAGWHKAIRAALAE